MNDQQRLYYDQALSDYEIFEFLEERAICHRLHYRQMCSEKLSKAYFFGTTAIPRKTHKGFVRFLRSLKTRRNIWLSLGFSRRDYLDNYIRQIQVLAQEIEDLAPERALYGPNPEYPWPPPPQEAKVAPVHYEFPVWAKLQRTGRGPKFQSFLKKLLQIFPEWF